jgi:hypothetical protein
MVALIALFFIFFKIIPTLMEPGYHMPAEQRQKWFTDRVNERWKSFKRTHKGKYYTGHYPFISFIFLILLVWYSIQQPLLLVFTSFFIIYSFISFITKLGDKIDNMRYVKDTLGRDYITDEDKRLLIKDREITVLRNEALQRAYINWKLV